MGVVIGITGLNRAGKDTLASHLVSKYGFVHKSVRNFLIEKINEAGLPVSRESMVQIANELRSKYGPEYIVMELYRQAISEGTNCVIESIRAVGEVEALKSLPSFRLWAVTASLEVCYERARKAASETDMVTFEEFVRQIELESMSEDKGRQNLPKCIQMADRSFENNGSREELFLKIDSALLEDFRDEVLPIF